MGTAARGRHSAPRHDPDRRGKPWTSAHLGREIAKVVSVCGYDGYSPHGLRKVAAIKLAEAGCTASHIAAVGGWRTLAMAQRYVDGAEQKRLATAAIHRLERTKR